MQTIALALSGGLADLIAISRSGRYHEVQRLMKGATRTAPVAA
ncbi:MAG: hypothetical protein U0164_13935 [Gemmatimonadaceae bacterium]